MSYTSLKRKFTEGATVRVNSFLHPDMSGIRAVLKAQTNGIYTGPVTRADGTVVEKCWLEWPKAAEVEVWEPDIEGEGAPKITFKDHRGKPAFTYELLEEGV